MSESDIVAHHTEAAPEAVGPYAQAVAVDGWLITSGQVGLDPASGEIVSDDFENQARQVFANLHAVLDTAGCGFRDVVKSTVYLVELADFARLNEIYAQAMGDHRPARTTVQVSGLPKGASLEIDMMARLPSR